MSIFRVEKNSNYTVISNYHLRDKNLSLRTIGLLSLILSLPESWDYSQAGLTAIVKDGEDSVRTGLKELEKFGYLERERERDENGRMKGVIYHIYETPKEQRDKTAETKTYGANEAEEKPKKAAPAKKSPKKANVTNSLPKMDNKNKDLELKNTELDEPILGSPTWENPILVNPTLDNPKEEFPGLEKQGQINKDTQNTDLLNTELNNPSIYQSTEEEKDRQMDRHSIAYREAMEEIIKENVAYDMFQRKMQSLDEQLGNGDLDLDSYEKLSAYYNTAVLDKIIGYMIDVLLSLNDDPIKIGDELISRNMVKAKFNKVDFLKMKRVVFELGSNPSIKNPKKYAISMLYND